MQPADSAPRSTVRLWLALIFLSGLLLYLPTVRYDFTYDDVKMIRENPAVHHPALFPYLWTRSYLGRPAGHTLGQIRPVVTTTYALTWWIFGDRPGVFHFTNALLHALNGLLVFALARRWLRSDRAALVAAMLFAVHPLHVEAVANVVGRAELLAVLFGLLAWLVHTRGEPGIGRGAAAGALYLLALLSKESALPLVALFAADDWLFGREARVRGAREWWRGRAILFSGHGAALILYFILRRLVLGAAGAPVYSRWPFNPLSTLDFWHRLPTAIALLGYQWRLFVWPSPLRPDYSYNTYPVVASLLDPRLLFAVAVLVGLGSLAIARWRRTPAIALGVLIHLLGISVVANIVFPIGHLFAERNLYFPSLGMCLIAALAAGALWRRWPATVWALAAVALALSMRTMDQGRIWRDNATLMANAAETTPNSTTVWAHLGEQWLLRANNPTMTASDREPFLREATACVERSLAIWPENAVALTNWARVEMVRGHVDEAVRLLDEALHLSPGFGMAVGLRLEMIRQRGDLEHLDPVISAALASDEVCIPALSALCRWRIDQGRADEAVAAGERLVHIQPFSPLFWLQLAQARQAAGDAAGAAAAEKEYQRWRWLLDEERENQSVSLR